MTDPDIPKGTRARLSTMALRTLILVTASLLAGCSGADEPSDPATLEGAFRGEFHFRPPTGTQIQLKYVWVGDTWVLWMRFTYGEELFKQVTRTNLTAVELNQASSQPFNSSVLGNSNAPAWWPGSFAETNHVIYSNEGAQRNGMVGRAFCWKDEESGWIYWQRGDFH